MAACKLEKFVITKGVENEFYFTVKANGSLLPMEITPSDTFSVKLVRLDDNTTVDLEKPLEVVSAINGKVKLLITESEVDMLISKRGEEVHNYYLKPVYSLLIEANTTANGYFVAKLSKVYVG